MRGFKLFSVAIVLTVLMAACGGGASTPAQIGPGAAKGPETPPKTAEAPAKGADAPAKTSETPAKAGAPSGSAPSGGAPGAASGSAPVPAKTGTAPSTLSDEDEWGGKQLMEAAKKEGKVVLYTAQFQEQEQLVITAFQKQFPEIKVEMNRLGGGPLYEKIKTELEANALRADVITLSDVGLMLRLKDAMADHSPPTEQWYSDSAKQKGFYYPSFTNVYNLLYNKPALDSLKVAPPKSWKDLADPRFKGLLAQLHPGAGGTPWAHTLFQRKTYGDEYMKALAANRPKLFSGAAAMINTVISGENPVSTMVDIVANDPIKQGAPIVMVWPEDASVVIPQIEGVTKVAKNPNAARLFMNWRLSRSMQQKVYVDEIGGFSARTDISLPKTAPTNAKFWYYDTKEYVELRDQWIKEWNDQFGYRPGG